MFVLLYLQQCHTTLERSRYSISFVLMSLSFFLSFYLTGFAQTWALRQGVLILKFDKIKTNKQTNFRLNFCLNEECPKLLCGLEIGHRRRQTIPMWNSSGGKRILQGITVCLVSAVLSTMWWSGSFQTVSRGHILVFFNRHCSTMNLVKEKQGELVPPGLKRLSFKLITHFADATPVSPSLAGPAGCCSLNFLNLINLKFWVRAPNGCCILLFRPNQVLYATSLVLLGAKPSSCEGNQVS